MEKNNLNIDKYLNQVNKEIQTYSSGYGDFMNPQELNSGLSNMMQALGAMGSKPMINSKNMAGINEAQKISQVSDVKGAEQTISNALANVGSAEVLTEVCTMSPALNASIRKTHSHGNYYFLKGKTMPDE